MALERGRAALSHHLDDVAHLVAIRNGVFNSATTEVLALVDSILMEVNYGCTKA